MRMNKAIIGILVMGVSHLAMADSSQSTTMNRQDSTRMGTTEPYPTMNTTTDKTGAQTTAGTTPEEMAKAAEYHVVTFAKGSANLSQAQRTELRNLVDRAKAKGEIKQVQIGAWSDKEFPIQTNKDLPKADRHLADRRGEAIKKYLKDDLKVADVTIHNMAKAPGALARAFNTEDAELKSLFARRGGETTKAMPENKEIAEELVLFRDHGKPSSAVIVIDQKNK